MGWFLDWLWGPKPEFKPGDALPFLRWRDGRLVRPRLPWVNEHKVPGRRPEDLR